MTVLCNACGNSSSITFANAAARSVSASSGAPCAAIAVVKNVRAESTTVRSPRREPSPSGSEKPSAGKIEAMQMGGAKSGRTTR
ncbi:MAG: hypothetical protein ACXWBO_06305 [Ilumatobacteraceae bacterium]